MPFNRTSMESKLLNIRRWDILKCLLIEPVWNRNICDSYYKSFDQALLIEPVWNRNIAASAEISHLIASFNRTSMESKLKSSATVRLLRSVF